ncbi:MAG: cyanophycinase [Holophagales bacterium]|nr:cyanophycinase [Holophagales bacterium]
MKNLGLVGAIFALASLGGGPAGADLLLLGGGDKPAAVLRAFVDLAGGPTASIVVFPTASELPDTSEYYEELFARHGAENVRGLELRRREQAHDKAFLAAVESADGIFFSGGDQRRITEVVLGTPLHDLLRRRLAEGAVVGGTSAGTACMSELMITGDGDFDVLRAGSVVVSEGLGLFPGAILDQHFVARQRQNRLLSLVLEHPARLGLGIDEATAVWWRGDGTIEVLGEGWVEVYDASRATVRRLGSGADAEAGPRLGVDGLRHHVLLPGDRFDLDARRRLEVSP